MLAEKPREKRMRLEDELAGLDTKIERTLDLGIELGDLGVAKDRLRSLRIERERVVRELAQSRFSLPTADELLPRLREKLRELEATLRAAGLLSAGCSASRACGSTPTGGSRGRLT